MPKRNAFSILLTILFLMIGLLLPFLTAAGQDLALDHQIWPAEQTDAHYAYQGTLMNRVIALNAHLNGSPAVLREDDFSVAHSEDSLIDVLSTFLPAGGAQFELISAFTLAPRQYAAQYRYLALEYTLENGSLSVILDAETELPLRMELNLPPEMLNEWLSENSLWDILRGYAACLNLGEPTDDETNISTVIRSQSAQIRGTAYKMTVTVIPSAGSLLLKLAASTPV